MQQQGYDFDDEYERARTWIQDTLNFDRDANFNTFEVCLGAELCVYFLVLSPYGVDYDTSTWWTSFSSLFDF